MKPRNHKSFFEDVANEIGVHKDVVDDIITFYYAKVRKSLSELKDVDINVIGLGTFVIRKRKLEKAIKKNKDKLLLLSHRDDSNEGSCLYSFNPAKEESSCVCRSLGDHSHSILKYEEDIWICDSLGGVIFKLKGDIEDKTQEIRKFNVFKTDGNYLLRGLEFDDNYIYVGASEKASNAERHKGCDGYVLKIDKNDKHNIKTKLIKNCGQINEILRY